VRLVDLALFRNLPYMLVLCAGAISNIGYAVTIFGATLYLQLVRDLTPLTAGVVFLAPALLVALSGPLGARLGKQLRPAAVMAGAGVVSGSGLLALTYAHGWAAYVPAFAVAGLGFGLGWTFANVGTQDVVRPERAGEASGVLLTVLVTAGGIGIAAAASAIALLESSGTSTHNAIRWHAAGDRDRGPARGGERDGGAPSTRSPRPDGAAVDENGVEAAVKLRAPAPVRKLRAQPPASPGGHLDPR
jgi:MFS family permease